VPDLPTTLASSTFALLVDSVVALARRSTFYPASMSDVTRILSQIEQGDPQAAEKLLPLVYDELRKLAAARLAHEKPSQTLQATALVHEAYIRLVANPGVRNQESGVGGNADKSNLSPDSCPLSPGLWDSRGHFFAAAAEAMRRIIVDQARHKATIRAGGHHQRIELSEVDPAIEGPTLDLLALDEALKKLEQKDPRKAELIKLRFFAGLSNNQAAEVLGIATSTADLDWAYARSWLHVEMSGGGQHDS
jgi:DNA-directed RNA polymerase specialized sigma24 family protein